MNQNETNARNTQNAAAFRVMVVITHDDNDRNRIGFVYQVWATVRPVTITPTGQATGKRIYNLFKTN
jgi:hypothetical protein